MTNFFNNYLFIFLAVLAGMAMPTQATINSKLAGYVESPISAAFISFAVGTVALFVYMILTGVPLGSLASSKDAPLIAWIGGFLGAFFVSVMATVVPRIGVALSFSLAIGGQMLVTLLIDHFGWLGVPEKPINLYRVCGAALITVGVILIRMF
ncbi:MAG TPA: DMT family transporter [Pyrinomonadaceae bacterium]|jgi:transporter family-2 protein|nr:DMT family transporter [Pyrinomonadaceae bacterium]